MNTYKIDFSKENDIGGAFDEFNHMVASIEGKDGLYELKFRSDDYNTTIDLHKDGDKDGNYTFKTPDGSVFTLSEESDDDNTKISLVIDDKSLSDQLLDEAFSLELNKARFNLRWVDPTQIELKTVTDDISEIISIALVLVVLRSKI